MEGRGDRRMWRRGDRRMWRGGEIEGCGGEGR